MADAKTCTPHPDPLQYANGYTLDLYCDQKAPWHRYNDGGNQASYGGESFSDCAKQAQADGWSIHRKKRTATCPECSRAIAARVT